MRFTRLSDWLGWQETLHAKPIDLGLERIKAVIRRMGIEAPYTVITVAGTNGKGSSVAYLEAILEEAGYRTGTFTSPHLLRYNERIRLDGREVGDAELCRAFDAVDRARGDISLTYFEFSALAALWLFERARPDIAVLEVGMGGRLDAVNAIDPDVALITALDVDHTEWLGKDRDTIALEKAGILRPGRPGVCSDPHPPRSLLEAAEEKGAPLFCLGRDYHVERLGEGWRWKGARISLGPLPVPPLAGDFQMQNAAGAIMALNCLSHHPVAPQAVARGLSRVRVPGRFQRLPGRVERIFDVAHNPQAAEALAQNLRALPPLPTHGVFSLLKGKDLEGVVRPLLPLFSAWHVAELADRRAAPLEAMVETLERLGAEVLVWKDVGEAARQAQKRAERVVAFGSFVTVAEAWKTSA